MADTQWMQVPGAIHQDLDRFNFDPTSRSVLFNLEIEHSKSNAVTLAHNCLRKVMTTTVNVRPELLASYDSKYMTIIAGVLLSGERLLAQGNFYFDFSKVEFQHIPDASHGITVQPKPHMTPGRAYLTNQRLLLLSVGDATGINFMNSQIAFSSKSTTKIFSATGSKTSTCRYESIPLADIRGVDMNSVTSGTSVTSLQGVIPKRPCWSYWCCCCWHCCCKKEERWNELPLTSSTSFNGVINVGALVPPWQTKCQVAIFVPQNGKTAAVVEFIRALQQAAPALQPNAVSPPGK